MECLERVGLLRLVLSWCTITLCLTAPAEDITKVDADCGSSNTDTAKVYVIVDRFVEVKVKCKGGNLYDMQSTDDVHYELSALYSGDEGTECVFRSSGSEIYTVDVLVGRAHEENSPPIWGVADRYLITCTFSGADNMAASRTIDDSKSQQKEVIESMAGNITSDINFKVIDILGNIIDGEIPVGKTIRLHAELIATNNERGIRALGCEATNSVTSYSVLLGGCGDGLVFSKETGFITTGRVVKSPFFRAFRLQGDTNMLFRCMFTACMDSGGCDGSSCT